MCPSTSRWTWAGSQFGIWPATAVIIPNENEEKASRPRIRSRRARRSFRILRRCPPGAADLRLRPSKRRILDPWPGGGRALRPRGVPHGHERHLRGRVDAPVLLLGHHHGGAVRDGPVERDRGDCFAALECASGLRAAALGDPGLVRLPPRRVLEPREDESALAGGGDDEAAAAALDLETACGRIAEDRRGALLREAFPARPIQAVRERRRPDRKSDRGGDI